MAKATITFEDHPEGVAVHIAFCPPILDCQDTTEAQRVALATRAYIDEIGDYAGEYEPLRMRTDKGDE